MGGKLVNSYLNQEETSNRIYQIDQKSSLINDLSITDNLFVMRPGFKKQVINEWVLREQADRVLKQLSMDLDLNKGWKGLLPWSGSWWRSPRPI